MVSFDGHFLRGALRPLALLDSSNDFSFAIISGSLK
jgi:hypothetical protein